jgi:hypothetical protein
MSGHDMHQSGETSVLANIQSSSEEVHDHDTMDFTPDPSTYTPKVVRNNFFQNWNFLLYLIETLSSG